MGKASLGNMMAVTRLGGQRDPYPEYACFLVAVQRF